MADLNERDSKLVQYLNEAYGKEKELEAALQAHIGMTDRAPYKKRLRRHLRETKSHARQVERRIKRIGGDPQTLQRLAGQATAALKGPLHALRGSGDEEKELKNAKSEYSEEAEEIGTYTAIEAFADSVGDRETAKVARGIRREEERMARYLERLIPTLTRAVARSEVPSGQRSTNRRGAARRGTTRRSATRRTGARRTSTRGRTRRKSTTGRGSGRRTTTRRSSTRRTGARGSSGRRSTTRRSTARRSTTSRGSGRGSTARGGGSRRTSTRRRASQTRSSTRGRSSSSRGSRSGSGRSTRSSGGSRSSGARSRRSRSR